MFISDIKRLVNFQRTTFNDMASIDIKSLNSFLWHLFKKRFLFEVSFKLLSATY